MYTTANEAFPPLFSADSPTSYFEWDQLLEPYLFPGRNILPRASNVGSANRVDGNYNPFLECPIILTASFHLPFNFQPQYGYNASGVGFPSNDAELLGLASPYFAQVVRESAITTPSEMITIGDPFVRATIPELDGLFQYQWGWHPINGQPTVSYPNEIYINGSARSARLHHRIFNKAFFDGHIETENFNRPFLPTDEYLRRWNTDGQPHRDRWVTHGGGV